MLVEFSSLKGELERLLVKNRGLTSQRKQSAQPVDSLQQSAGSQEAASSDASAASFLSYCSSSSSSFATPHTAIGGNSAECSSTAHWQPNSRQLDDDVAALLQQVDTTIAAPRIMFREANQLSTAARLPARPANESSASVAAIYNYSNATGVDPTAVDLTAKRHVTAETASDAQPTPALVAPVQESSACTSRKQLVTPAAEPTGVRSPESAISVSRQIVSQPDNVAILRAACSVQSPKSQLAAEYSIHDLIASVKAEEAASPHHWHTNSLADQGSLYHADNKTRGAQHGTSSSCLLQRPMADRSAPSRSQSPEHVENIAPHREGQGPQIMPLER